MFPSKEIVERVRAEYPVGTRIRLLEMDDVQAPPIGTLGTVIGVDDTASILVKWDNGCGLNVVYGQDHCEKVLPDVPSGSSVTILFNEDGTFTKIGETPKIDPTLIPEAEMRCLCRTILRSVKEYFKDPKHVEEFEAWKKTKENGDKSH